LTFRRGKGKPARLLQVLFPLLALVPRREVSHHHAATEVMAPLLGAGVGGGDAEQGQEAPAVGLFPQLQASAQANETFREPPGIG